MTTTEEHLETYLHHLGSADLAGATDVVLDMHEQGTSVREIVGAVLAPAQVQVGELWQQGHWSVADEHAATSVTEAAVLALGHVSRPTFASDSRHIVLICPEGEWHTLPARMTALVATTPGARVTVLGASLPADQLARRLSVGDIDLVALSCTMPTNLLRAAGSIAAANKHDVPVMVGGRAFGNSARRARALGADGWCNDPSGLLGPLPARTGSAVRPSQEVLVLESVDPFVIDLAYGRMVASFPLLATMSTDQQARTREDFAWIARYTGAGLLAGDPSIVDELLLWLHSLLAGRIPAEVVTTSALLLADAVEPDAPRGAELLRQAAGRTSSPGEPRA